MDKYSTLNDIVIPEEFMHLSLWQRFQGTIDTAKWFLQDSSTEEISKIANEVEQSVREEREQDIQNIDNGVSTDSKESLASKSEYRILLERTMFWFALGFIDTKSDSYLKLPKFFSVMSLLLSERGLEQARPFIKNTSEAILDVPSEIPVWFFDALSASSMAITMGSFVENYEKFAVMSEEIKRDLNANKKKGALARHEKTSSLLRGLVEFYDGGGYTRYSDAVSDYLDSRPEKEYKHLAPTNRHRTLIEGLSAIKRGKRIIPEV